MAISWTQPGATMGVPAGSLPAAGLYFANGANWGKSGSASIGVEVPAFIYSSGWNILGANYGASAAAILVEVNPINGGNLVAPFNPVVNPITLSWNLGNGFFVSFGEDIYIPLRSETTFTSGAPNSVTSGAAFEQRFAASYLANDWILSANTILGITTTDAAGIKTPDYFNLDATVAHTFGKWEVGAVGYGAWDLQSTPLTTAAGGRGEGIGLGALLGYNLGGANLTLEATHQIVTRGFSNYGKDDTRVWTSIVIPIWSPAPAPAVKPVVAKY